MTSNRGHFARSRWVLPARALLILLCLVPAPSLADECDSHDPYDAYDCCNGVDCWILPPGTVTRRCFSVINKVTQQLNLYGCVGLSPVDQTRWTSCPWSGLNQAHGQCTGSHVSSHSFAAKIAFSPTYACAPGNGWACFDISTPTAAGAHKVPLLVSQCNTCPGANSDEIAIWVKLGASTTANPLELLVRDDSRYLRVGALTEHNPGYADAQDSNHWGMPAMVAALRATAGTWRGGPQPPGVTGCTERPLLRINDMALGLGGRYDINNNWNPPHSKHGDGMKVDISSARGNAANGGVPLGSEGDFCRIAKRHGFKIVALECDGCAPPPSYCDSMSCTGCVAHWHLSYDN